MLANVNVKSQVPVSGRGRESGIVASAAHSRLRHSGRMPLRNVSCSYRNGALILTGVVSSYYQKQMAQTLVAALDGVNRIVNNLEVVPTQPPSRDWP